MRFHDYTGRSAISIHDLSRECGVEVQELRKCIMAKMTTTNGKEE